MRWSSRMDVPIGAGGRVGVIGRRGEAQQSLQCWSWHVVSPVVFAGAGRKDVCVGGV